MSFKFVAASLAALGMALAHPASAEQTESAQPDSPPAEAEGAPFSMEELMSRTGEMGVRDRELFGGAILRGRTDDGHPYVMLIGPDDFAIGEEADFTQEEMEELQEGLEGAQLGRVEQEDDWVVVQGRLDGLAVLAGSGDFHPDHAESAAGAGEVDEDAIRNRLGEAGLDDQEAFEGELLRARMSTGEILYLLIGPEGFAGGEEIALSEQELRQRFEQADEVDAVEVIEERVVSSRGSLNDRAVLVFAGSGLTEGIAESPPAAQ